MLKILFIGLCLFQEKKLVPGRTVFIPDISAGTVVNLAWAPVFIEPHKAYLAAAERDVESCPECVVSSGEHVMMLDLKAGDEITLNTGTSGPDFDADDTFKTLIPRFENVCPAFTLPDEPSGMAKFVITAGILKGEKRKSDERMSTLELNTTGLITFSVKNNDGKEPRTMILKAGTKKVTIGNQYTNGFSGKPPLAENHWLAYYALSTTKPLNCGIPKSEDRRQTTIACSNGSLP